MNLFPLKKKASSSFTGEPDRLELTLKAILAYGEPMLFWSKHKTGWKVIVDMNMTMAGSKFKIESETHGSPIDAADQCLHRIKEAVGRMK